MDTDDDRSTWRVTVDDDPGQDVMRDSGRYHVLQARRGGAAGERCRADPGGRIGNAWLSDDGFGGEVAQRLEQRELPPGVSVMDFGTGGLDLAYEVMRGYHALIIVDVSRQGEAPGTLYVMEPDRRRRPAGPSRTAT